MVAESEIALHTERPAPTKLYVAMQKARAEMSPVMKTTLNTYDKYYYATLVDYVDAIQPALDKHGLLVVNDIEGIDWLDDRMTERGKAEKVCRIMLRVTCIHAESGEARSVNILGEGQDRADKAFYKADTGARKYGLANLFNLATADDPERDGQQQQARQAPAAQQRQPAQQAPANQRRQPPAQRQAARPAPTFIPPADWPNTTLDDLHKWIDTLQTAAMMNAANKMMFGEDSPFVALDERDPLIKHLHLKFHSRYDTFDTDTKARYEPVARAIDETLTKHLLDVQAEQTFQPSPEVTVEGF